MDVLDDEPPVDHLIRCSGCDRCDFLMSLYTACDKCGHWMNNSVEHYYDISSGETLCFCCEPRGGSLK